MRRDLCFHLLPKLVLFMSVLVLVSKTVIVNASERPFILMSGGQGVIPATVSVLSTDDMSHDCVAFPDIPKRPYGGPDLIGLASGVVGDQLILCGGMDFSPPFSTFNSCYKTNVVKNNGWTEIEKVPEVVAFAGGATDKENFYIVGGLKSQYDGHSTNSINSDKIRSYNVQSNNWTTLPVRLPETSNFLCAVAMDQKLMVAAPQFVGFVDLEDMTWNDLKLQPDIIHPGCAAFMHDLGLAMIIVGDKKSYMVFVPSGETHRLPDMNRSRSAGPSLAVRDLPDGGKLLVVAGGISGGNLLDIETFELGTLAWMLSDGDVLDQPRIDHSTAIWNAQGNETIKCRK